MSKTKDLSKNCKNIAVKIRENVKFQMSAAIMKGYG
jgi:hypothetical protein